MDEEKLLFIVKKQQEIIDLLMENIDISIAQRQIKDRTDTNDFQEAELVKEKHLPDIDNFKYYLRSEGMSKNCVYTYSQQVWMFFRDYGGEMSVEALDRWVADFDKVKPKTANLRINAMKKYFKFAGIEDFYKFKKYKEARKFYIENVISEEDYKRFCEWAEINNKKLWVVLRIIGCTGVRVSELIELKTETLENGFFDIVGKGKKQRRIFYPDMLCQQIKPFCGETYLVENRFGRKYSTRGVSELLKRNAKKAGIEKKYAHAHGFRHFFAKKFAKENGNITLLGDLLGHSDPSTTAIYTRMSEDEQKESLNAAVTW